ncbi:MAG: DUF4097 family beta strand repeat protein, partial [bacterium]|nr:DUF4097 family beta strand repeat protein [bacterium]
RARFGGYEGKVEVIAMVQDFATEEPPLMLETAESKLGAEVTVGYRTTADSKLVTIRDQKQLKRADLVVFVPLGISLKATTDHGMVEVKGVKSNVHVTTNSGDVWIRGITGELDVSTVSGPVLAVFRERDAERDQSIVTETGDVTVSLNNDVNLKIVASTSGRISTDFSMKIDHKPGESRIKHGTTVIGKGAAALRLTSGNGHIHLIRRPLAREAKAGSEEFSSQTTTTPLETSSPSTIPDSPVADQDGSEPIHVELGRATLPLKAETTTGDITAIVAEDANVTIRLATSGRIRVDFSVEIEYRIAVEPAKYGQIVIGSGETIIDLTSRQGTISVLSQQSADASKLNGGSQ